MEQMERYTKRVNNKIQLKQMPTPEDTIECAIERLAFYEDIGTLDEIQALKLETEYLHDVSVSFIDEIQALKKALELAVEFTNNREDSKDTYTAEYFIRLNEFSESCGQALDWREV